MLFTGFLLLGFCFHAFFLRSRARLRWRWRGLKGPSAKAGSSERKEETKEQSKEGWKARTQRRSPQHESHILGKCRRGFARSNVRSARHSRVETSVTYITASAACTQPLSSQEFKQNKKNQNPQTCPDLWRLQRRQAHGCVRESETQKCQQFTAIVGFFHLCCRSGLSLGLNWELLKGRESADATKEPRRLAEALFGGQTVGLATETLGGEIDATDVFGEGGESACQKGYLQFL